MLEIFGTHCTLREFTEEQLQDERYFTWLRDLEVVKGIYRLEYLLPLPREKIESYVRGMMASEKDYFFSLHRKEDEAFIGTVKLGHIDWRTGTGDVGILIGDKNCWGKGFATDAVHALCEYSFQTLSLRKLTGGTAGNNLGMIHCFLKVGFRQEGLLRKKLLIKSTYEDHLLFGLFREEYQGRNFQ